MNAHEPGAHPGHRGTRAIQRMVEFAPSTGGLALWVGHQDDAPAADAAAAPVAPVATDGHVLHYAPAFARLSIDEQAGWVAHEVLHIALRHPQRFADLQQRLGEADLQLFNICADAVVNSALAHLSWLSLPAGAVHLHHLVTGVLGQSSTEQSALAEWDVERLYAALDDRRPPESQARPQPDRARREGGADQMPKPRDGPRATRARALGAAQARDLLPDPQARQAPERQAEAAREWHERVLRAHAGDGEFSMLRSLIKDLRPPRTPWEQVLRSLLTHGLSTQRSLSWSRPTRSYIANQGRAGPRHRMPWEPGTSGTRPVPRLAVVIDVSGSIEAALLQRFSREIESIARRLETAAVLVIGDDQVRRVHHFDPQGWRPGRFDLSDIAFQGGGGTDFSPMLQEADRHRPDIGVVLTDLQGPAAYRPSWPVIWAVPEVWESAVVPYGRKLVLA
jgi:predicted metal-dependent peptidase